MLPIVGDKKFVDPIQVNVYLSYPLKAENIWLFEVFRRYKKEALAQNWFKVQ